ncbi:MAG TPA: hypothetical protein VHF27_05525 [Acidimicrobiales bacterium]|nr:hypothetical protein [Acidimicrobiales bacterium]
MSTVDLDRRAREAGAAARASVTPVAALATPSGLRRAGGARLRLAGGAAGAVAAVALAVALASPGDDVARLSTTPAGQGASVSSQPSGTPPPPTPSLVMPTRNQLAAGTANDGRAWELFLAGPSGDLCVGVDGTGVCAGEPFGSPPYRPAQFDDGRAPALVFGRLEAGVAQVSVVLGTGETAGPEPVIGADGGPYYVVELPDRTPPVAVVGHRPDGSTVRHDR